MSKFEKLQKNIDNKLLTIKYIGSRGEGVSSLTTEINNIESDYTFFIPFTLPNEVKDSPPKVKFPFRISIIPNQITNKLLN